MWLNRRHELAARVEPVLPVPRRAPMRIRPAALAAASAVPQFKSRAEIFKPAQPAPGVLPTGASIAMDDALSNAVTWAAQGDYSTGVGFLGFSFLSELAQRPEYRRITEIIAKEMTRKWVKLKSASNDDKTDRIKALTDAMDRFRLQDVFRRAAEHDGFFGRGHVYIDTGATPDTLKTPLFLDPKVIGKGALKGFRNVEAVWVYPNLYDSRHPLSEDYYRPVSWWVMGQEIHTSRLLRFVGREVPDLLKSAYSFGGLSLSQMAMPYVENWIRTRQSVSDLLHSFTVWKLATNMDAVLQGSDGGMSLTDRAALFNDLRDNRGLMLTDKDSEELSNISAPLSSLDHLQAQAQEQMASVSGIPLVKLLGITPTGLNASSDGEIRAFYDWVAAQQEHLFRAHLKTCLEAIQLSEFGEIDPEITFEFEPLWQLDEAAQVAVEKTRADTHAVYLDGGVVGPDEVRKALAMDEASPYQGLDLDSPAPGVQGMEDVPDIDAGS